MKNKEIKKQLVSKIYLTCQGEANAGDNQKSCFKGIITKTTNLIVFVVVLFINQRSFFS